METTGMAYVGRKSCGCVVAAVADEPAHKQDVANAIAEWINNGLTVDRVTDEYVRVSLRYREEHEPLVWNECNNENPFLSYCHEWLQFFLVPMLSVL